VLIRFEVRVAEGSEGGGAMVVYSTRIQNSTFLNNGRAVSTELRAERDTRCKGKITSRTILENTTTADFG